MELLQAYSNLHFLPASYFSYDASEEVINYDPIRLKSNTGKVSLLHEIAHAKLGHFHYIYDLELLMMEIEAWQLTRKLALKHQLKLNESYINDCINSYDSWVEARATCPNCNNFSLQESEARYQCYRCHSRWKVSIHPDVLVKRRKVAVF